MIYIMKGNFAMTLALIGVANAPWLQRAFFSVNAVLLLIL